MNGVNVIGGIACLGIGLYVTIIQIKKILGGRQDQLGDYRLLIGGIGFVIGGILLIIKYS